MEKIFIFEKEIMKKREKDSLFAFIDLFAGIGGFHLALHSLGGECVYASEWDSYARKTYRENYYSTSPELFDYDMFRGDITDPENQECIPEDIDVLCAGFPCQPFSQAGFKKGFDEARGTLFFEIANIIKNKNPKSFFLENVRHLFAHDNGKTFDTIKKILVEDLNYSLYYQIVKASDYGLPTHRPRLFMVGFRDDLKENIDFSFPDPVPLKFTMSHVFNGKCNKDIGYTVRVGGRGSGLNDRRNWDSYLVNGKERKITSKEAKAMMGFPENFVFPVTEAQALKQLGNSVAVLPVKLVAQNIIKSLRVNVEKNSTNYKNLDVRSNIWNIRASSSKSACILVS